MAVDQSSWDGSRALSQCDTAAQFHSICAGERSVGDPGERQHWALPHHYLGKGPNAAGVRNALARLDQTEGLTNKTEARSHLESHMSEINPEQKSEGASMTLTMERLTVGLEAAQLKAEAPVTTGERTIQYYASAFGNKDNHGHVVEPGAFDEWLPAFYAKGQAHPISFNHSAVLDPDDPTNVIAYAAADSEHVWVDDYGLAIKGQLNTTTEKGKAVEWQIEHGLLKGASLAMFFDMSNTERRKEDGALIIKKAEKVVESGLVPNPANQSAVLMWMKSEGMTEQVQVEEPYMTLAEFEEILKANPTSVQSWHDSLVAQGAVCKHDGDDDEDENALDEVDDERLAALKAAAEKLANQPESRLSQEAQERARKLRLIEASLP